jgi:hypothetical protein
MNKDTPSTSSSFFMERLRDGWDICSSSDALRSVPQRATASNCSSRYDSINMRISLLQSMPDTYTIIDAKQWTCKQIYYKMASSARKQAIVLRQ